MLTAAARLVLLLTNLTWAKAPGSGGRTELARCWGVKDHEQQKMQWENSSSLMRPLLQLGLLKSDVYKRKPKCLNR